MPADAPITETYVDTAHGGRLRCLLAGDGPNTLVLIPGWTMTADVFVRQFERFAGPGLRVVAFDPRGQGDSTKDWGHHDYDTRGDDVARVLEQCAPGPVVLGSWSQGTFEHLSFVRRHGQDRTVGTVIIDGAPRQLADDARREWAWFELNPDSPWEVHLATWIVDPTTNRAEFNREFIPWMLEDPRPEAVGWFDELSNKTPDGIASLINAMAIPVDFQEELRVLSRSQPTAIFARDEWRATVEAWVQANAPSAQLVPMRKHAAFWERPEQFNAALAQFLSGSVGWQL